MKPNLTSYKTKSWLKMTISVMILSIVTTTSALAFKLSTRVFSISTITFTTSGGSLSSVDFDDAINTAAANWNSTGTILFVRDSSSPNLISFESIPSGELAITQGVPLSSPYRIGFIMKFNSDFVYYNGPNPVPPGAFDLRTVVRHEFGHALGLSHVSSGLMKPVIAPQEVLGIDSDAIDGASYLYQNGSVSPSPGGLFGIAGTGGYDDLSTSIGYKSPNWITASWPTRAASGTVTYSNGTGTRAYFSFNGTRVTRRYTMANNRGNYLIYIDGSLREAGSGFVPGIPRWQIAKTYTTSPGDHILEVRRIDGYIDMDQFIVNVVFPPAGSYDDTATSQIQYIGVGGSWIASSGFPLAYNGTVRYSNTAEDGVGTSWYGNKVTYVFTRASNRGIATVTIDGVSQESIDLYSGTTIWQSSVAYTLPVGYHTIFIGISGDKNGASSGKYVDIDRFITQ